MTPLRIILHGDGAVSDVPSERLKHGRLDRIIRLEQGTNEGNSSVAVGIVLDDGTYVVGQTTMRLFQNAAQALKTADEMAKRGKG